MKSSPKTTTLQQALQADKALLKQLEERGTTNGWLYAGLKERINKAEIRLFKKERLQTR